MFICFFSFFVFLSIIDLQNLVINSGGMGRLEPFSGPGSGREGFCFRFRIVYKLNNCTYFL